MIARKIISLGSVIATAALYGCFESGTEPISTPDRIDPQYSSSSRNLHSSSSRHSPEDFLFDDELEFNYEILDYYYLYSNTKKELGDFDKYYNASALNYSSKSYCLPDGGFERVCYMYDDMSDRFTRYFDPSYAEYIRNMLTETEEQVGIGAIVEQVETSDSTTALVVSSVYENGPSYKAGLSIGDTIVSIDGTVPKDVDAFNKLTAGEKNDQLAVKINRDGEAITLRIIIDAFNSPTVILSYKDSIPIIQITEFTEITINEDGTYGEFVKALKTIKDDSKVAIIDLRGNPGGDVDHCNRMSAELLSKGDTIIIDIETNVDSSGSGASKRYFQKLDTIPVIAKEDGIGKDLYYVFLADTGSASCAEVMLSAITVNKKSPFVGQVSYGKGIGQYVIETYAAGLALVTGLQSTDKNGDIYHKVGIVPDYKIDDPEEQMEKALEIAKNALKGEKEVRTEGYGTTSTGHFDKAKAMEAQKFPSNKKELLKQLNGAYKIKKF